MTSPGHVVGDDPVGLLGDLLGDCLLDHALGLGGEADESRGRASLAPSSARMSRVGDELELGRPVAFLELFRRRLDPPVGDRRDQDRRVSGK